MRPWFSRQLDYLIGYLKIDDVISSDDFLLLLCVEELNFHGSPRLISTVHFYHSFFYKKLLVSIIHIIWTNQYKSEHVNMWVLLIVEFKILKFWQTFTVILNIFIQGFFF